MQQEISTLRRQHRRILTIVIKGVTLLWSLAGLLLSRVVELNELQTNVFGAASSITILAPTSSTPANLASLGWTGCPTKQGNLSADCAFPLGIVVFNNASDIEKRSYPRPPRSVR